MSYNRGLAEFVSGKFLCHGLCLALSRGSLQPLMRPITGAPWTARRLAERRPTKECGPFLACWLASFSL